MKCNCNPKDEESFCPVCCPESYECLKEPHIEKYVKEYFMQILENTYKYDHHSEKIIVFDDAEDEINTLKLYP